MAGTSLYRKKKRENKKKRCDLFEGTHLGVMICCILTPDGRFRLTTKPALAWSNGIFTCHFFPPVHAQEAQQLFALRASGPPCICAFGLFPCVCAVLDKAGFPWQPLKQILSMAHTFSKVCFVEVEVWCLKVAGACHDRHGISWA